MNVKIARIVTAIMLCACIVLVLTACDLLGGTTGGTPESGTPESGTPESGTPESGTPESGTPESGTPESGTPETGTPESGTPESGTPESGTPESGTPESGTPESGTPESGTPESGTPESSTPDSACEHPYVDWVLSQSPTCVQAGLLSEMCLECHNTFATQEIPKLDEHTPSAAVIENSVDPTCTKQGSYDSVVYCAIDGCGAEISREKVTVDAAHDYINGLCGKCNACTFTNCSDGLTFGQYQSSSNHKTCYLASAGNCKDVNVVIPHSYNGYDVIGISSGAFRDNTDVRGVVIPPSVTTIEEGAFDGAENLKNVYLYDLSKWCAVDGGLENISSVENLYTTTGKAVDLITNLVIPDGVASINKGAFVGCDSITSVSIPESVMRIAVSAFDDCPLLCVENGVIYADKWAVGINGLCQPVLRDDTVGIADSAFTDAKGLIQLDIPDSVLYIGEGAFYGCSDLLSIQFGSGVKTIGEDAIGGCGHLVEIINKSQLDLSSYLVYEIHSGERLLVKQGDYYFIKSNNVNYLVYYVGNETAPVFPDSYNGEKYAIGKGSFANNCFIEELVLPENVEMVHSGAFYACTALKKAELPGVKRIGTNAFYSCIALEDVVIPSIEYIDGSAFCNCDALKFLDIPSGNINAHAFQGCDMLESVSIGKSSGSKVSMIGSYAFANCDMLTRVRIYGLESVYSEAFAGCTALESVYIKDIETWLGISFSDEKSNPLYYADSLYLIQTGEVIEDLVVPDGTEEIKGYSFANYGKLTSVSIPNSVSCIAAGAFLNCAQLESVSITEGSTLSSIGTDAFGNCTSLKTIILPNTAESIAAGAFSGCNSLQQISIPKINNCLGYIFDAKSYLNNSGVPASLRTVNITGDSAIPACAFEGCSNITSVRISADIMEIGIGAFRGCASLSFVEFEYYYNWYYVSTGLSTSRIEISSASLSSTSTAAEFLTSNYVNYSWVKWI